MIYKLGLVALTTTLGVISFELLRIYTSLHINNTPPNVIKRSEFVVIGSLACMSVSGTVYGVHALLHSDR
jgi:hypothetical protein